MIGSGADFGFARWYGFLVMSLEVSRQLLILQRFLASGEQGAR